MAKAKTIKVSLQAEFLVDPRDHEKIAQWDEEKLKHLVFEMRALELKARLNYDDGIRGTVVTNCPTPYELKLAQLNR